MKKVSIIQFFRKYNGKILMRMFKDRQLQWKPKYLKDVLNIVTKLMSFSAEFCRE